jgi:hypothetical protein
MIAVVARPRAQQDVIRATRRAPAMLHRAVTIVPLTAVLVLASAGVSSAAMSGVRRAIATHEAGHESSHEASISIGVGRGIGTMRTTMPARSAPVLNIPVPASILEHRAAPSIKPNPDVTPDFAVPLRRHRMAMPDSAIPALGDLSF